MPSTKSIVLDQRKAIKGALGVLESMIQEHPEAFEGCEVKKGEFIHSAGVLNHRIQYDGAKLLELLDEFINSFPKKRSKKLPLRNNVGGNSTSGGGGTGVPKKRRKTKVSS